MDLELGAMILQRFGPNGSQACIQPASSDKYARKGQFDITSARYKRASMTPSMEVGPLDGF
jgi:hypothetical protein